MQPRHILLTTKRAALDNLQVKLGYSFVCLDLLLEALTHSSSLNEGMEGCSHNERLEFLGDSVLDLVISEYLMETFQEIDEGVLSKMKAHLVSQDTLAALSSKLNLGAYLVLGRGEELHNGRQNPSILANTFEAVVAAVYLDGGFSSARQFVLNVSQDQLNGLIANGNVADNKSQLQELCQRKFGFRPVYHLRHTSGPDHHQIFEVDVHLNNNRYGTGAGKTKKKAEQQAAKQALLKIEKIKS